MRARSALFTLFGDVVRPAGGEAWLSALTAAMEALGFTAQATRTALHRMGTEGWVEPRRVGRYAAYRLTEQGVDRLEEAAARIYRLRAADWDGRWRLLMLPPDVVQRAAFQPDEPLDERAPTELTRTLRWIGFGRLSAELFVSPHDHDDRVRALLEAHGVDGSLSLVTTSESPALDGPGREDRRIVERAWDLRALRAAHAAFLERWPAYPPEPADPREAFVTRILLVHHWRSFLFLDPGLPAVLLPSDWRGGEAALRFRERYDATAAAAWSWWAELTAANPASLPSGGTVADPTQSPFARGLDALATHRGG